ncbi:5-formyltetrahydrofolate cyclo-ligase [Sphingomonas sp.]|jgi:5-formyltetrahydrofolate cyclo-ligase|uniref:5-formyltetrahydrofolate cyclo-ligase n=1 Tax=Sphingomonas sp. TaxID=28214 RepID=UPI00262F7ABB|nr:5-formyltetrahydrofolate cyclo-ligase [Sphingomonas sp.]MDF2494060.1 5-formyltetrahydrofolate cyclo-ligase [Sphingomonas sp.]
MNEAPLDKQALRRAARSARQALDSPPPVITPRAELAALLVPGMTVASYAPVGSEADPQPLVDAAIAAGCRIALPHVVDHETPMRFLYWEPGTPLTTGPFNLRQPDAVAGVASPDLILTPLVAFDRTLARLGQGAGHYDRAFAAHPAARRIGVAFSVQEVERLPTDPWDVPLHAIITEQEWITS